MTAQGNNFFLINSLAGIIDADDIVAGRTGCGNRVERVFKNDGAFFGALHLIRCAVINVRMILSGAYVAAGDNVGKVREDLQAIQHHNYNFSRGRGGDCHFDPFFFQQI